MSIKTIFDQIESDNSRNFKQHILEVNQGNKTLQRVFELALDPLRNFYIKKKIPKIIQGEILYTLDEALNKLDVLSDRVLTGNAAIKFLQDLLSNVTSEDANIISRVVNKKLRCGVSVETVNTVWPNLVFQYSCMLCEPFSEKHFKKFPKRFFIQTKEDGGRFNAVVRGNTCKFFTRNGNSFLLDETCENLFITLAGGHDYVFDGELLVNGAVRQEGNGKLTKAIRGTITQEEIDQIYFTLWDTIPYKAFVKGKYNTPYAERLDLLEQLASNRSIRIRIVNTEIGETLEDVKRIFEEKLLNGLEGVVIKDPQGIWEGKRVKTCLKLKAELDNELVCTGTEPGEVGSKYENCIGALICESSDGLIKVGVASGLKDPDRHRDDFIGKIIWVKHNGKIKCGDNWSLFLPVFKGERVDKSFADTFEDFK